MAEKNMLALNKWEFRIMSCEICLPLAITLKLQGKREKILVTGCYTFNMMKKMFHISPNPPLSKNCFSLWIYISHIWGVGFFPILIFLFFSSTRIILNFLQANSKRKKLEKKTNKINRGTPFKVKKPPGP